MRLRNVEAVLNSGERLSLQLQHDLLDAVVRLARQALQRPGRRRVVVVVIADDAIGIVGERSPIVDRLAVAIFFAHRPGRPSRVPVPVPVRSPGEPSGFRRPTPAPDAHGPVVRRGATLVREAHVKVREEPAAERIRL